MTTFLRGLQSLQRDSYRIPQVDEKEKSLMDSVPSPPSMETMATGVTTHNLLSATPNVYKTMNSSYGNGYAMVS